MFCRSVYNCGQLFVWVMSLHTSVATLLCLVGRDRDLYRHHRPEESKTSPVTKRRPIVVKFSMRKNPSVRSKATSSSLTWCCVLVLCSGAEDPDHTGVNVDERQTPRGQGVASHWLTCWLPTLSVPSWYCSLKIHKAKKQKYINPEDLDHKFQNEKIRTSSTWSSLNSKPGMTDRQLNQSQRGKLGYRSKRVYSSTDTIKMQEHI